MLLMLLMLLLGFDARFWCQLNHLPPECERKEEFDDEEDGENGKYAKAPTRWQYQSSVDAFACLPSRNNNNNNNNNNKNTF